MGARTFVGDAPPDPLEVRVGTVLGGRWLVEQLIGAGGMAAVYRVRADGRAGAAKVLHASMARNDEIRARFTQEALAVSRLAHRAIVRMHDSGKSDDGCPFLVMELLDGESLAERMRRAPPSVDEALEVAEVLLDVLAVAHASSIIHRDIKPENIFLLGGSAAAEAVKLLDFGVARVRRHSVMHVVTREGTAIGTPHYMPQEQIKGVDVDHRADLFAVGAVLFELISGRTVHQARDDQALMVKMLTTPAPPLASVCAGAPEPLCALVDRALAFEAKDRYPDAATMLADVRSLRAGELPLHAHPPQPASRTIALETPTRVDGAAAGPSGRGDMATRADAPGARGSDPRVAAQPTTQPGGPAPHSAPGAGYGPVSHPGGSHPGGSHPGGSHPGGSHPGGSHPGGSHPGGSHPGVAAVTAVEASPMAAKLVPQQGTRPPAPAADAREGGRHRTWLLVALVAGGLLLGGGTVVAVALARSGGKAEETAADARGDDLGKDEAADDKSAGGEPGPDRERGPGADPGDGEAESAAARGEEGAATAAPAATATSPSPKQAAAPPAATAPAPASKPPANWRKGGDIPRGLLKKARRRGWKIP